MSGEQKSVRARYILVAAITNVTIAGIWNIYVTKVISTLAYITRKKKGAYEIPGSYHFERYKVQWTTVVDGMDKTTTYDLDPKRWTPTREGR